MGRGPKGIKAAKARRAAGHRALTRQDDFAACLSGGRREFGRSARVGTAIAFLEPDFFCGAMYDQNANLGAHRRR
jgi:hypothetical protein